VPRQKAAEIRKIPESGSVIPREGVERKPLAYPVKQINQLVIPREGVESLEEQLRSLAADYRIVIPREGVESAKALSILVLTKASRDPERGS
jgi:hypothetical protein